MRARGINYDTGFLPGEELSRRSFTSDAVRRDLAVIADELHCDAVRISGRPGEHDLGSYGVVRILDESHWEPKKAFHAMAAR